MSIQEKAEQFAKQRHIGMTRDGGKPYLTHLEGIVNRLKKIGVNDEDLLAAGWLHDIIEDTDTTFDDINSIFGKNVAVLVLSLTKDKKLSKKELKRQYIEQIKNAPWQAQLIKLCDIASNLKSLKDSNWSKNKIKNQVKEKRYYLDTIKPGLVQIKPKFPSILGIIDDINKVLLEHEQRQVTI